MRNVKLYTHQRVSNGAANLGRALNVKRIKHQGSRFRGNSRTVVINWGAATLPANARTGRVINSPEHVAGMQNKLTAFQTFQQGGVSIPEFTHNREVARTWAGERNTAVVCRTLLRGSAGNGIVIANTPAEVVHAPLYTKYVKKQDEYRVHILGGEIIDTQKKAKRRDVNNDDVNYQVRTHDNGFIYMRDGVVPPDAVLSQALQAVNASGLDFGAVDVIWNDRHQTAYVLEINTAPGMEGTTVDNYARAFRSFLQG